MTKAPIAVLLHTAILFLGLVDVPSKTPLHAAETPNILLFIADNWAWPHAGVLGDPTVKTPTFDRVAREGILFNNAFCPVPSCSPTRSCLLTGRVAHQLGPAASLYGLLDPSVGIFTKAMEDAGYEIAYSGKGLWGTGFADADRIGKPMGEEYESLEAFLAARQSDKPFFFMRGNVDTAIGKWPRDKESQIDVDPDSLVVPATLPDVSEVREDLMAYYAAVNRVDADAGNCVTALQSNGLLDKTVVFVTSDNGSQLPHGLGNCYDQGTRVPLAIRWPGHVDAGRVVNEFVSVVDFAPTFLELAKLPPIDAMTGESFVDVMLGESIDGHRDHVFVERERHANVRVGDLSYPVRGIRNSDFLYLWNLRPDRWPAGDPQAYFAVGEYGDVDDSRSKDFLIAHRDDPAMKRFFDISFAKRPSEELYDLRKDPEQLVNIAGHAAYVSIQQDLRDRVQQWMRQTNDPRVDPSYDAWDHYPYIGERHFDEQGKRIKRSATTSK